MSEATMEEILKSNWNVWIWLFPQYEWKAISVFQMERPIAEV